MGELRLSNLKYRVQTRANIRLDLSVRLRGILACCPLCPPANHLMEAEYSLWYWRDRVMMRIIKEQNDHV